MLEGVVPRRTARDGTPTSRLIQGAAVTLMFPREIAIEMVLVGEIDRGLHRTVTMTGKPARRVPWRLGIRILRRSIKIQKGECVVDA